MTKRKQSKNRKQIKRQTRHFQLRVEHPIDSHVGEILDFAKSQRREVTVIRDSVRLFWALENNDLSVLFDMFPHLKPQVNGQGGGGGSDDLQQIKSMLEIVVQQRKVGELVMQSVLPTPQKPIVTPPVAEITSAAKVSADAIADNFLSMFQ